MKKVILFLTYLSFILLANAQIEISASKDSVSFADTFSIFIKLKNTRNFKLPQKFNSDSDLNIVNINFDSTKNTLQIVFRNFYENQKFSIKPIPLIVSKDTILTDSLQIFAKPYLIDNQTIDDLEKSMEIDTNYFLPLKQKSVIDTFLTVNKQKIANLEKPPIFNLKSNLKAPFTFKEFWLRYKKFIIPLLLLLLLALTGYLLYKKYGFLISKPKKEAQEIKLPPHVWALQELEKLEKSPYLERGEYKEFYFHLTQILKKYLEERYKIEILELTTSETLNLLKNSNLFDSEIYTKISSILKTGDLAKFAKYKPAEKINSLNFNYAKEIIEKTKPIENDNQSENNISAS